MVERERWREEGWMRGIGGMSITQLCFFRKSTTTKFYTYTLTY